MSKIVVGVSGGTGRVGRRLVDKLLEMGYQVKLVLQPDSINCWEGNNKVTLVRGTVESADDLKNWIKGCSYLIHCAVMMDINQSWRKFWAINVDSVRNLLKIIPNGMRIVYISSVAVFEDTGQIIRNEDWLLRKRCGEKYVDTKVEALKIVRQSRKVITVMPSIVIDKNELLTAKTTISNTLLRWLWYKLGGGIPGGVMSLFGSRERIVNMVEVNDLVKGIILAMVKGKLGEQYILAGNNYTVEEYLERANKLRGKKSLKVSLPESLLKIFGIAKIVNMNFSSTKAMGALGYKPVWKL